MCLPLTRALFWAFLKLLLLDRRQHVHCLHSSVVPPKLRPRQAILLKLMRVCMCLLIRHAVTLCRHSTIIQLTLLASKCVGVRLLEHSLFPQPPSQRLQGCGRGRRSIESAIAISQCNQSPSARVSTKVDRNAWHQPVCMLPICGMVLEWELSDCSTAWVTVCTARCCLRMQLPAAGVALAWALARAWHVPLGLKVEGPQQN